MKMECVNCKTQNLPASKFCTKCGESLYVSTELSNFNKEKNLNVLMITMTIYWIVCYFTWIPIRYFFQSDFYQKIQNDYIFDESEMFAYVNSSILFVRVLILLVPIFTLKKLKIKMFFIGVIFMEVLNYALSKLV